MLTFHLKKGRCLPGFPDPREAQNSGLLALGGDLEPSTLIAAYTHGIFPWYSEDEPLMWWSLSPRLVLFPADFHISSRSCRAIRNANFEVSFDRDFPEVIHECAKMTESRPETWITRDMLEAYIRMHRLGYAHSVEIWKDNRLVGGLYGLCLGKVFFGESMFRRTSEASRAAIVCLVTLLRKIGVTMIDCQEATSHMQKMGAVELLREEFLEKLTEANTEPCSWPLVPPCPVREFAAEILIPARTS